MSSTPARNPFAYRPTPASRWSIRWARLELLLLLCGLLLIGMHVGTRQPSELFGNELLVGTLFCQAGLRFGLRTRLRLANHRQEFFQENRTLLWLDSAWLPGIGLIVISVAATHWATVLESCLPLILRWTELLIFARGALSGAEAVRNLYTLGLNPALLIVLSFVILIGVGTLLLLLPAARNPNASAPEHIAPWLAAFYTSTSACCVTGLVIVDTGSYWTRTGQFIIMCLIQVGGLGIMTFGGFVALISGRAMQAGEGMMFRDLFEADQVRAVRSMIWSILIFTLGSELVGAVLLWELWPELPIRERIFFCLFHSVAAFCNAGFALMPNNANLMGYGLCWQIWGVIAGLVIIGGIGFGTLLDSYQYIRDCWKRFMVSGYLRGHRVRARLGIHASLVWITTGTLLVGGTLGLYFLDRTGSFAKMTFGEAVSAAWFQSVIARTAGFNTIDIGALTPASKLLLIILMFIGASPVSTGGGIKTISLAVGVLGLGSILRGRDYVEVWQRTLPDQTVKKAFAIIGTSMMVVLTTTLVISAVERQGTLFLDHFFEATSAFGTVGLSTGISSQLSIPSQLMIILTMFVGRVGPLTLFLALLGSESQGRYQYPVERVTLG